MDRPMVDAEQRSGLHRGHAASEAHDPDPSVRPTCARQRLLQLAERQAVLGPLRADAGLEQVGGKEVRGAGPVGQGDTTGMADESTETELGRPPDDALRCTIGVREAVHLRPRESFDGDLLSRRIRRDGGDPLSVENATDESDDRRVDALEQQVELAPRRFRRCRSRGVVTSVRVQH